jgi:hypothetical protein
VSGGTAAISTHHKLMRHSGSIGVNTDGYGPERLYSNGMTEPIVTAMRVLLLLGVANSVPIFARKLLKNRFSAPLDGGLKFIDGRPLLGASKTIRGLVLSIAGTALVAPWLGFDWITGAGLASVSMLGDLLSSFAKRRLGLRTHSQALGLDQIPESLLPLLVFQERLGFTVFEVAALTGAFLVLGLVLSRLFFKLHIRERPY